MAKLNQTTLEECLEKIAALQAQEVIEKEPTKIIIVPYPDDTEETFAIRVKTAEQLLERMRHA